MLPKRKEVMIFPFQIEIIICHRNLLRLVKRKKDDDAYDDQSQSEEGNSDAEAEKRDLLMEVTFEMGASKKFNYFSTKEQTTEKTSSSANDENKCPGKQTRSICRK